MDSIYLNHYSLLMDCCIYKMFPLFLFFLAVMAAADDACYCFPSAKNLCQVSLSHSKLSALFQSCYHCCYCWPSTNNFFLYSLVSAFIVAASLNVAFYKRNIACCYHHYPSLLHYFQTCCYCCHHQFDCFANCSVVWFLSPSHGCWLIGLPSYCRKNFAHHLLHC